MRRSFFSCALVLLSACACSKGNHRNQRPPTSFSLPVRNTPADPTPVGSHPRLFLSPALMATLQKRIAESTPEWKALQAKCDEHLNGNVEWPDGKRYADHGSIGEGYQGDGYFEPLMNIALCYQITRAADPAHSKQYGAKGVDMLIKMSEPSGPHSIDPLRDSGFGIRFYGVGMAIGYDWLYDQLEPAQRTRVYEALNRWVEAYEDKGFGHDHPQGNYFAAYYATKALSALSTQGENPKAPTQWADWIDRVHGKMVQPYYASYLTGGGWPEGWGYGPLATLNMLWPLWAAQTAKGIDLVHDPKAPFSFAHDQALYLMNFAWPSRHSMEDRGTHHTGEAISATPVRLLVPLSGLLRMWNDPAAPVFQRYTSEVRDLQHKQTAPAWEDMLFWDRTAPQGDINSLPLSYLASGMQTAAARSSWALDAVWGSFTAGSYVGNPDSSEMLFDQGALTIVHGDQPLLVNTLAQIQRHTPGTQDGEGMFDLVYADLFGNHEANPAQGNRSIFNIFYARSSPTSQYGQSAVTPNDTHTQMARFEDGGEYVLMRGEHLEEMYRKPRHEKRAVSTWTRQVIYLRPSVFVVDDRTAVISDAAKDQWQAFHLSRATTEIEPHPAGGHRLTVGQGASFTGVVTTLLPKGNQTTTTDLFNKKKVFRLEVRPPTAAGSDQRWLTVFDAAPSLEKTVTASALSSENGNVQTGHVIGTLLQSALTPPNNYVVLAAAGVSDERIDGEVRYKIAAKPTTHILTDMPSNTGYTVTVTEAGSTHAIKVTPGGPLKTSAAGVLRFQSNAPGQVSPSAPNP